MIQGALLDLGGVIYVGDRLLPGARDALLSLRAAGIPLRFITNTTRLGRAAILDKVHRLGLTVGDEDLFTPVDAARRYLVSRGLSAHLLVHPRLEADLADLAGEPPDTVLVGDAGDAFSYAAMNRAFRLLLDGAPLLALGKNRYFAEAGGYSLDLGPFVVALEYAAGMEAMVLGKPARDFFLSAVDSLGLAPDAVVMVGDDAWSDVGGALDANMQAVLVRTGKYRAGDEAEVVGRGARVVDDLDGAVDLIL